MLAGDEVLGIISVQSHARAEAYDVSHLEVLKTIAVQAALAIENARLYARTDQALARRVQELGSILRTAREGILLFDLGWQVLAANLALAELTGIAQAEWVGARLADPDPEGGVSPLSRLGYSPDELEGACEALAGAQGATQRDVLVLSNSEDLHVERTLGPVRDDSGAVTGWLLTLRDVTEEVELGRLRDQMGRMLVHDLRSPLSVIKGGLEMMGLVYGERDAENFGKALTLTQRTTDQMLQLVNDLLDISRLESGQQSLDREPVVVEDLLRGAALPFDLVLDAARITLDLMFEPNLPLVSVDLHLMRRALSNLIDNAIKFTPERGHVRVWARRGRERAPGAILVGVSDSGPGILPEDQERLFQMYERTGSAARRKPGSGVGLAFCKLAVEAHGERIWVESVPGKGSSFLLTMAIADDFGGAE